MPLTDAQRGALHLIRSAGWMAFHLDMCAFFAGNVQLTPSVARALIRHRYVVVDEVATQEASKYVVCYKLTGKDEEETE